MNNYGNSVIYKIDMRYLNGKIYKLVSNVTGDVYYGSTCNSLKKRLSKHKINYKVFLKGKTNYTSSFKIIETGDYKIELVENYACLCRKQLESIERVYIENYNCINKYIPNRTRKEYGITYYQDNKEKKDKQMKKYREKNRDRLRKQQGEKNICECGVHYTRSHKARHFRTKKHQKYLNAT